MNRKEHFDKTLWCQNRKKTSYWLDGLPEFNDVNSLPPPQVDVAIVGSGYTGLNAALQTIRGGRSTVVFNLECLGKAVVQKMEGK